MANPNEYLDQLVSLAKWQKQAMEQQAIERAREWERARGVKLVKLPTMIVQGANPFTVNPDNSQQFGGPQGPDQGWIFSLQRLVIEGLTRTATPDIVQITSGGRVIWELNGNQYISTWGKGAMMVLQGEYLGYQSVGTFQATTGKITISGTAWQVSAEEVWKLL